MGTVGRLVRGGPFWLYGMVSHWKDYEGLIESQHICHPFYLPILLSYFLFPIYLVSGAVSEVLVLSRREVIELGFGSAVVEDLLGYDDDDLGYVTFDLQHLLIPFLFGPLFGVCVKKRLWMSRALHIFICNSVL